MAPVEESLRKQAAILRSVAAELKTIARKKEPALSRELLLEGEVAVQLARYVDAIVSAIRMDEEHKRSPKGRGAAAGR